MGKQRLAGWATSGSRFVNRREREEGPTMGEKVFAIHLLTQGSHPENTSVLLTEKWARPERPQPHQTAVGVIGHKPRTEHSQRGTGTAGTHNHNSRPHSESWRA